MKRILALTLALVATSAQLARSYPVRSFASSLSPDFPLPGPIDGPLPLFVSVTEPNLRDPDGNVIRLGRDIVLGTIIAREGWEIGGWRPLTPLPAGDYTWSSGVFSVDPARAPGLPPTLQNVSLAVSANGIAIDFEHTSSPLVAVEVTREANRVVFFGRAARPEGGQHNVEIGPGFVPGFLARDAMCVALIPYAEDGTAGERLELGCSDPETGENFTHLDDQGCALTQTTNGLALLFGLVVVVLRRVTRVVPS